MAYVAEYGALPVLAYVKETFGATFSMAFAEQPGGRLHGAAICDQLHAARSSPDTVVNADPKRIAEAFRLHTNGGEIDYEGASGSMDWDENGDPRRDHIGIRIRRYTENERIKEVQTVAFKN